MKADRGSSSNGVDARVPAGSEASALGAGSQQNTPTTTAVSELEAIAQLIDEAPKVFERVGSDKPLHALDRIMDADRMVAIGVAILRAQSAVKALEQLDPTHAFGDLRRSELAEMDRTNKELKDLRLGQGYGEPRELADADRGRTLESDLQEDR